MAAFGNGALFVEKFIEKPRHIEVQILGEWGIVRNRRGLDLLWDSLSRGSLPGKGDWDRAAVRWPSSHSTQRARGHKEEALESRKG